VANYNDSHTSANFIFLDKTASDQTGVNQFRFINYRSSAVKQPAFSIFLFSILLASHCSAFAADVKLENIKVYERDAHNRELTECDQLGAHPSDPEKLGAGLEQDAMDLPAVISACTEAVEADPANPRLNYQLARAYGYSGKHAQGDVYRRVALKAGYPQSLFVVGYIRISGWDGKAPDPCYGGELVRLSAESGRLAGLIGFPHYAVMGKFAKCGADFKIDQKEMADFLAQAKNRKLNYYQRILVEQLEDQLLKVGS